ncbi:hypothetical protein Hanom_Chr10g00913181 [Helianthus anomalus]
MAMDETLPLMVFTVIIAPMFTVSVSVFENTTNNLPNITTNTNITKQPLMALINLTPSSEKVVI